MGAGRGKSRRLKASGAPPTIDKVTYYEGWGISAHEDLGDKNIRPHLTQKITITRGPDSDHFSNITRMAIPSTGQEQDMIIRGRNRKTTGINQNTFVEKLNEALTSPRRLITIDGADGKCYWFDTFSDSEKLSLRQVFCDPKEGEQALGDARRSVASGKSEVGQLLNLRDLSVDICQMNRDLAERLEQVFAIADQNVKEYERVLREREEARTVQIQRVPNLQQASF